MLTISRRLPAETFLKDYLELFRDKQFQKLGKSNSSRIQSRFLLGTLNSVRVLCRAFVI